MTGAAGARRLPRGRHGLSRSDVTADQRARILAALAEVMTSRGYVDTPVSAVLERAGVSRETFYQLFGSKQDCFIAALTDTIERLATGLSAQVAPDPGRPAQAFDRVLSSYLSALAAAPATARLFLIETYAAGPEAMSRRLELHRRFSDGLAALFGARTETDRFACEALVGAVVSLVTASFVRGEEHDLDALRAPLVELARRIITTPDEPVSVDS